MKILSKKKYNKLIEDLEESQKKVEELKRINESIGKKLEDKKTSCKANVGKDFCNVCKNSYSYKNNNGNKPINCVGCLLDVPCEDFKRKEDN
jgi:hypothetical protein|uniref:Uncharacterized protein n=1 Tax=Siphoviridae sp. ctbQZ1 TaxID=2827581 RepID=A0A8S5LMV6_9CAUD|nr:MAG TPA: hypothetical protein [Siphoviridae sp. ctbQZ1]